MTGGLRASNLSHAGADRVPAALCSAPTRAQLRVPPCNRNPGASRWVPDLSESWCRGGGLRARCTRPPEPRNRQRRFRRPQREPHYGSLPAPATLDRIGGSPTSPYPKFEEGRGGEALVALFELWCRGGGLRAGCARPPEPRNRRRRFRRPQREPHYGSLPAPATLERVGGSPTSPYPKFEEGRGGEALVALFELWCRGGDSNPHSLARTRT